jgi:dipeptidyl aminopeptidase/acylaminoacyl peptidase
MPIRDLVRALLLVVACFALSPVQAAKPRPLAVDDLFELEAVGRYFGGPWAFSADGSKLAYVRVRPEKTLANHKWEFLWGNAGGDVWVQNGAGGKPVNITNGLADSSGWWAPEWSPDGKMLAMLSTRGGNATLWVWNAASGELRQLTQLGVDLSRIRERPYTWIDANHLLYPALPEGEQPTEMRIEVQTPQIATKAWPKVIAGQVPTASVLDSGVQGGAAQSHEGRLLRIDASSGAVDVVATGSTRAWRISPTGTAVAFARQSTIYRPQAHQPLPFLGRADQFCVEVASVDGTPVTLEGEAGCDVFQESLRWSPDGRQLAYLGYAQGREDAPSLYRVDLVARVVSRTSLGRLDVSPAPWQQAQLEWTAGGGLMVYGAQREDDRKPASTARRDWWLIAADGGKRLLTGAMKSPPHGWWAQEGRAAFVALSEGDLWRLTPAAARVQNLTERFAPAIDDITWPGLEAFGTGQYALVGGAYDEVFFATREGERRAYHRLDFRSGQIQTVNKPTVAAELVAYAPQTGEAIFYESGRNGLAVWRGNATRGDAQELFVANRFLRDIAEGAFKSIEYTSLNGKKLKAWVILPYGYREGVRYPALTWVYPGSMAGPTISSGHRLGSSSPLNMQLVAAQGYAVLIPSLPLAEDGVEDDPMLRLPEGVLPAVTRLVDMGIADPERLFVAGQSYGGFATYGLITQTHRFRAAVALAGLSDLYSLWGQFDARRRYTDDAHEDLFQQGQVESITGADAPPWRNLGRYLRNSPIFYVDRVETPLMIIQGDQDYVAMQQGEEYFTSLYRQGKRARFVRYWGEGHVLQSPANIRDMWQRIFAWFDEFSTKREDAAK